jgi:hypothetical protein
MVNIAIHIQFNSIQIQLKRKLWMQIGGEGFENLLVNMVLKNKTLKGHKSKKTPFHASLFGNGLS